MGVKHVGRGWVDYCATLSGLQVASLENGRSPFVGSASLLVSKSSDKTRTWRWWEGGGSRDRVWGRLEVAFGGGGSMRRVWGRQRARDARG